MWKCSILLGIISVSLCAADFGRVDINGFRERIPLEPLSCVNVGMVRNPQKALSEYALEARMFGNEHIVWQTATLRFKAGKNGRISLMLLANWIPKGILEKSYHGRYPRAIFRSVEAVKGCRIENPDFAVAEDGGPKGWKLTEGAEYKKIPIDGAEVPVVIGRCYAPVMQEIEVKAGEEVELKIVWALEAAFKPPFWTGTDGKDIYTPLAERIVREKAFRKHPHVLFRAEELPALRKKLESPYFEQYRKDLFAAAAHYLKRYPENYVFPFQESPAYLIVTETLISAYLLEGNPEYAKRAIHLGMNFIDAHFLKIKVPASGKFRDFIGLESINIRPFALTYDILFDRMDDKEKTAFLKMSAYLGDLCRRMTENQPEFDHSGHKNYLMGQMGSFALLALSVSGELPDAEKWRRTALHYMKKFSTEAIRKDGMFPEGPTYFCYTGEHLLLAFAAMERFSGEKYFRDTHLPKTAEWLISAQLPWKWENDNFSDGNHEISINSIPALFQFLDGENGALLASRIYGDHPRYSVKSSLAWIFLTDPGKAPLPDPGKTLGNGIVFPHAGMCVFNDGWNADSAKVFFYATSYRYAAHSQADRGQFNFYSKGRNWAGDSGYANDGKEKNSAASWEAHTQVLIDGKGESYLPGTRVSGTFSIISDYLNLPSIGYAAANLKSAYDYGVWYTRRGGIRPNNPVRQAVRHLIFMRGGKEIPTYLLVYDDIRKDDAEHRYEWQMQVEPTNILKVRNGEAEVRPLNFGGNAVSFQGTGDWTHPLADGYALFGFSGNGNAVFEFDAPKAGMYYLWTLAGGRRFMAGCDVMASLNGKRFPGRGRMTLSPFFARPVWARYSLNLDHMGKPEPLPLKKGKNTLEMKVMTGCADLKKGVFVSSADILPSDLEKRIPEDAVTFDSRNLVSSENVKVVSLPEKTPEVCRVVAIFPEKTEFSMDYFQPSRIPIHPRLRIGIKAVSPEFLIMLYPHAPKDEEPAISRSSAKNVKIARIQWKYGIDWIALNPHGESFPLSEFETDAGVLVIRSRDSGEMELLAAASSFLKKDGKMLYQGAKKTLSIVGKQLQVSDFVPVPMPTDSL